MSLDDHVEEMARRTMTLFFMVDTSGSMTGAKMGSANDAIRNVLPILQDISDTNPDAEIKVAAMQFSSDVTWVYDEPRKVAEFEWQDMQAGGLTQLGEACEELCSKLSRHAFLKSDVGQYFPVVILLSDGGPTDNFDEGLATLKANNWFKYAIRIAIAIGEADQNDCDLEVLCKFTGNRELVIKTSDVEALKKIIKLVVVTSSKIGSTSAKAGDSERKVAQVASEIKKQVEETDGAEVVTKEDVPLDDAEFD